MESAIRIRTTKRGKDEEEVLGKDEELGAACVPQSWYLSVDTQLFVLSPLFLLPLRKHPKWTIAGLIAAIAASLTACFTVGWVHQLKGDLLSQRTTEDTHNFFVHYYYPTHTRMSTYLIGAILGYYVYQLKKNPRKLKISGTLSVLLWVASLGLLSTCVFAGHDVIVGDYDRLTHSVYLTLVRPTWALALCWVIFACTFGYGGPVTWFLSCGPLQVFSKLSYSMYIVHYSMLFVKYGASKVNFRFSELLMYYNFWGDFWFSAAISVVWTLMFESPILILEKIIFGGEAKKPRRQENGKQSA